MKRGCESSKRWHGFSNVPGSWAIGPVLGTTCAWNFGLFKLVRNTH